MGLVRIAREVGNLPNEEWREVEVNGAVCEISNMGRVRFTYTPKPSKSGKYAEFKINGVKKSFHIWVAETFNGPCP